MKVPNNLNERKFLEMIETCTGKVELVTKEGDRLNLKSKLSQYVFLAGLLGKDDIKDLEVLAYEKEDMEKISSFFKKF